MKHKEVELLIDGVIHFADVEIYANGDLKLSNTVKDNGEDNCDPCPITDELIEAAKKMFSDEIEEAKEEYDYELRSCGSAKALHYLLND